MARNVYLDPFGTYTSAMDRGIGRQMEVESNRRQNRAADFDYNYMAPIQYSNAALSNRYNQAALPYNIRNLGYTERATRGGLFDTEYARGQALARDTGMVYPALSAITDYLPNYGYEVNPETGMIDFTRGGHDVGRGTVEGILGRYMLPETMQQAEMQRAAQQQAFENQIAMRELENNLRWQAIQQGFQLGGSGGANRPSAIDNFGLY